MADSEYHWTGEASDYVGDTGAGLPYPTMDSPPNAPEQIEKLARGIYIDADDSNLPTFTADGPPLHFYGKGRPDAFGISKRHHYAKLLGAPFGSTFSATTDEADNFGACEWRLTSSHVIHSEPWLCTVGETRTYQLDSKYFGSAVASGTFYFRRSTSGGGLQIRGESFRLTSSISNSGNGAQGHQCFKDLPIGWRTRVGSTQWGRLINGSSGYSGVGRFWRGSLHVTLGLTADPTWIHNFDYVDQGWGVHEWPSESIGIRLNKAHFEQMIEEVEGNPDHPNYHLLDHYRDELAELEGQNNG